MPDSLVLHLRDPELFEAQMNESGDFITCVQVSGYRRAGAVGPSGGASASDASHQAPHSVSS